MRHSSPPRAMVAGAVMAGLIATWTLTGHGQLGSASPSKLLVQETVLPAMDRGLRDQDPPRPARSRDSVSLARADGNPPYMHGSLIVKLKGDATADFVIVKIPTDADPEAAAAAWSARPDVEYAQPRYRAHAMAKPNDTLYASQWNFSTLDMERAWDIQPGASSDIIVAVLDSGMAFRSATIRYESTKAFQLTPNGPVYPPLGTVVVPFAAAPELGASGSSRFVSPHDFIWNDDVPVDLDGHGTHVAGTIGQLTNNGNGTAGMAYNVRLMPVKVIQGVWDEIFSSPEVGTDDTVALGIRYAADHGAKVINLSIGREDGGSAPVVNDAIRYAVSRGAFVAVAAGNSRAEGNLPNRYAQAAPSIDGMVAVGAVGRNLDLAYYSTTAGYVELSAPGGDLRQGNAAGILQQTIDLDLLETFDRPVSQFGPPRADAFAYYFFQGTSMATPHVAGFAALLMQQGITSPAAVEAAMKQFATDKGPPGRDNAFGFGLINPRATLRGLGIGR